MDAEVGHRGWTQIGLACRGWTQRVDTEVGRIGWIQRLDAEVGCNV